jgi:hypothetical protein
MLQYSHKSYRLGGSTNSSFLALIPKETNPVSFSRFRAISLCNSSCKIMTKNLATQIKKVLPKIISSNQGGLMQNRQIVDIIVLSQEAIHSSITSKNKGMVIKLDMVNAFNQVCHNFLFMVMKKFNFNTSFIRMLDVFIRKPLLNGRPTSLFHKSRGFHQGCPLSPLLLLIIVETLRRKLEIERTNGKLPGLQIARGVKTI